MDELISVIVPVYNVEKFLPRCLQAISEQTYRNLEIIFVDDGSTDRSGTLCDEFAAKDSRARVIHQPNAGLWAARNAGLDLAQGAYLFIPDGDDYFHRDILRILHEAINFGRGYDLAICHKQKTEIPDEDTSSSIPIQLIEVTRDSLFLGLFSKDNPIIWKHYSHNVWNKLYRRRLIDNLRFKPFVVAQDREFLIRLYLTVKEAILVDYFLYFWVQHPESIMHSPSYLLRRSMCHVKMDYEDYPLFIGEEFRQYKNLLLEDLYNHTLIWRELAWFTPARKDVCKECKTIMNHTWKEFYSCNNISFRKKAVTLLLSRFSRLAHCLISRPIKKAYTNSC